MNKIIMNEKTLSELLENLRSGKISPKDIDIEMILDIGDAAYRMLHICIDIRAICSTN